MQSVELNHASGAAARVFDHGAHVTSWKTPDGVERLFLSERAEFKPGAAIRGGVPIIFPQFAALGSLPKHGFARTTLWQLESRSADQAIFSLTSSAATTEWPHLFNARYVVGLGQDELSMALTITNTDTKPCVFTAALHTYLRVQSVERIQLQGLQHCRYRDSAHGNVEQDELQSAVSIQGEVDRIYFSTPRPIILRESGQREIQCHAAGFADTVIWNPGAALTARMADMTHDGYLNMICVEAAAIGNPVSLQAGQSWTGIQTLKVLSRVP